MRRVRVILNRVLIARQLAREICEWAPQSGEPLRRLFHVGASLFIAMDGVRGGYLPHIWVGDADIMMKRINDTIAEIAPDNAEMQLAIYQEIHEALHPVIAAALQEHIQHLAESRTMDAP